MGTTQNMANGMMNHNSVIFYFLFLAPSKNRVCDVTDGRVMAVSSLIFRCDRSLACDEASFVEVRHTPLVPPATEDTSDVPTGDRFLLEHKVHSIYFSGGFGPSRGGTSMKKSQSFCF